MDLVQTKFFVDERMHETEADRHLLDENGDSVIDLVIELSFGESFHVDQLGGKKIGHQLDRKSVV